MVNNDDHSSYDSVSDLVMDVQSIVSSESSNQLLGRMIDEWLTSSQTVNTASGAFHVESNEEPLTLEGIRDKFVRKFVDIFEKSEILQFEFMQVFREFIYSIPI